MIGSLFGTNTVIAMLKGGLEETSATQRGISARVAQATTMSATADFASQLDAATKGLAKPKLSEVDLQQEMAALADTQIRFEASTKLLHSAYGQIRTAMRDRA